MANNDLLCQPEDGGSFAAGQRQIQLDNFAREQALGAAGERANAAARKRGFTGQPNMAPDPVVAINAYGSPSVGRKRGK